ncbi:hypothetical protein C8R44DRAFT_884859 [Mycena epipterygia]|nr:hypothetical protein C8R44DRAFT_884859 [Mycena epipterygia]
MATPFHRQQQIDEHFNFHDLDKHAASEMRQKLPAKDFHNLDYLIINKGYITKDIALVKTRYRTTYTRLELVEAYTDGLVLMGERRYRLALDKLERLVVQRLLELTKLGMSGVESAKALKTRADAISKALAEYNIASGQLNPPREQLTWPQVIQTVCLAEFDILRDTRTDIRNLAWTNPSRREARLLYFDIKRAKEEIQRLNIEITRLITFMIDDHVDYWRAIRANIITNPHLAREMSEQWKYRTAINRSIVSASELNLNAPLPPWAIDTLGLTQVVVEYEEDNDAPGMERELVGIDDDMMIQLMENLEVDIAE